MDSQHQENYAWRLSVNFRLIIVEGVPFCVTACLHSLKMDPTPNPNIVF